MRKQFLALIFTILLAGCQPKPAIPPREPLSAQDVQKMEAEFIKIRHPCRTRKREGKDFPAAQAVFSKEAVVDDRTHGTIRQARMPEKPWLRS